MYTVLLEFFRAVGQTLPLLFTENPFPPPLDTKHQKLIFINILVQNAMSCYLELEIHEVWCVKIIFHILRFSPTKVLFNSHGYFLI